MPYSPLGSGRLTSFDDLPENDYRRMMPRFAREVFDANPTVVAVVKDIAADVTPSADELEESRAHAA